MFDWLLRLTGFRHGPPPPPPLVQRSRGADPEARKRSAGELAASTEPWALDALVEMLRDTHPDIREAAKGALRGRGPDAVPALIKGLSHGFEQVGQAAAELLGEAKSPDAVAPLLQALKFAPRPVQLAAKRALARYGADIIPALEEVRAETQLWVRQQIEDVLTQIRKFTPDFPANT